MYLGITGASGLIGRKVIDIALRRGHEVIAFSRHPEKKIPGCGMRGISLDAPPNIDGCEAILHLAGETVAGLWTPAKKRRIRESRVQGTKRMVEAIAASKTPPEVLVCGSATGWYPDAGDTTLDEKSPAGAGFLAEVVKEWEGEARKASDTRVVLLRTSLVLSPEGGALGAMAPLFKAGLGSVLGDGRQWMPWIHLEDEAKLALFAVENLDIHGPLNAAAPWPVRNREFTEKLAQALHRPAFFRVPAFAMKLLGEFSRELLDSKKVAPAVALEHGFQFRFPEIGPALKDLFA